MPGPPMNRRDYYCCRRCDRVFDDQIRYEIHLAESHDHLRDTLPVLLERVD